MDYQAADFTPDRQRNQTMAVVHFVMTTMNKFISPDDRDYAHRELFEAIQKAGVDIITSEHRASAGLPPRSPMGWTDHELKVLEMKRMEALLAPIPPMIMTAQK